MLTGLKQLGLTNNSITGDIPSEIGKLSLLEGFDVDGNQFSSLPTELGNLVLLQRLSIAENSLRGILPSQIGNLISLVSLRLENNGLTGTVPTEFGRLSELKDTLDLSNNRLSGPIPSELGKLIFLRNLLLNDNQLNGTVPVAFSSLRRLAVLRLESNNLTGIVGDAVCSVFNNTYPVFVADCAPPAEIECPCCMYCCVDHGACSCQFANTELSFLCAEFSQSSGLQARMGA
jgi:Leucine-rich repeat (LRR) protein